MAEVINTNVFDAEKKFVDFAGLDYFWEKAKAYVDGADKVTADKVAALEGVVGNDASGLVKDLADLKATVDALGDIEGGEGLGGMIDAKIGALDVEDAAVDGQYVSSVAEVDGKIVVSRAALPVYEEVGVAADAAAQALADAKAYVDGIVGDVTGEDGAVTKGLNSRIADLEAIDHDKLAADAASAAVAGVIDGAPEKFDTLKEVAQWIADSESAATAADLVTRVKALEDIDHDAYVAADTKVLEDANAYADGLVMVDGVAKFDAAGAAADAQAAAIAQAKLDAAETLKAYYTKEEVDGLVDALNGNIDSAQAAAESYAKTYTDALFTSFKFAQNSDIDGLFV